MNPAAPAPTALDPLAQLRDIHLPPPIGWWPPAPGWWLLASAVLLAISVATYFIVRRRRQRRYRHVALRQLETIHAQWQQHGDQRVFLQNVNQLLKQVALAVFPAQQVAALSGDAWLRFLDSSVPQPQFDRIETRVLADLYRADTAPVQPEALRRAAEYWLRRHRC